MNRGFVIIALFLAAVILQTSFLPALFPATAYVDLVAMVVIVIAIMLGFERNILWIVAGSMLYDILGHWTLGRNVLVMVLIGYLTSFFSRRFLVGGRGLGFLILILLVVFALLIGFLVDSAPYFDHGYIGWRLSSQPWLAGMLGGLVLNLLMLGLIFAFLKRLLKYLAPESSKLAIK